MADQPRITPREAQYRKTHYNDLKKVPREKIICLACGIQLRPEKEGVFQHKRFGILLCKECNRKQSDEKKRDLNCIICNKMPIYICGNEDRCKNEFCKRCISRANPDSVAAAENDGWSCFECMPNPIWEHRAICALVSKSINQSKEKSANEESETADERPRLKSQCRGMTIMAREKFKKTKDLNKNLQKIVDPESDEEVDPRACPLNTRKSSSSSEEKTAKAPKKSFVKVNGKANGVAEAASQSASQKSPKKKVTFVPGSQKEPYESDTESDSRSLKKENITKMHSLLFKKHLAKVSEDARELYSTFKTDMENLKRRYGKTELKNMHDVVKIVTKYNSTLSKFRENTESEQEKLFHSYKAFCKVAGKKVVPIRKQKPAVLSIEKKTATSDEEDSDEDKNDLSSYEDAVEHKKVQKHKMSRSKKNAIKSESSEEEKAQEKKKVDKSTRSRNLSVLSSSSSEIEEKKNDLPTKGHNNSVNASKSMIESSSDEFVQDSKSQKRLNVLQKELHAEEKVQQNEQKKKTAKNDLPKKAPNVKAVKAKNVDSVMEVSSMDSDVDSDASKNKAKEKDKDSDIDVDFDDDDVDVDVDVDVDIHDAETDCERAKAEAGARLTIRKDLLAVDQESVNSQGPRTSNNSDEIVMVSNVSLTADALETTLEEGATNDKRSCTENHEDESHVEPEKTRSEDEKSESSDEEIGKKTGGKKKIMRRANAIVDSSESETASAINTEDRGKAAEKKKDKKEAILDSDCETEVEIAINSDATTKVDEEEEEARRALLESCDSDEDDQPNSEEVLKKTAHGSKAKEQKPEEKHEEEKEDSPDKVTDEEKKRPRRPGLESSGSETEVEDQVKEKTVSEKVADVEVVRSDGQEFDPDEVEAIKAVLESGSETEMDTHSETQERTVHSDSTVVETKPEQLKEKNTIKEKKSQKKKDEKKIESDESGSEKENQNNEQKKRKVIEASSEDELKKTKERKKRSVSKSDSSCEGEQQLVPDQEENTSDEEERARRNLLATSSSDSDDSGSSKIVTANEKQIDKRGIQAANLQRVSQKFKLKNNLYYRADKKLRLQCKVVVKRLQKKHLKEKRHQLALKRSAERVKANRLKSLLSVDNLEKKKRQKSKSDSDASDSEMLTRKQKRQKVAEEKDSLLNHLNKTKECSVNLESDSSTSASLSKAKMDNDKIFSKDELLDMANERAKRKLVESDDDTEILDLTEKSDGEDKDGKKEAKKARNEKKEGEDDKDDSEKEKKREKAKWKNDKLLKGKIIDSSDSEDEKKVEKLEAKLERAKLAKDNSDSEGMSSPTKKKLKKKKARQRRVLDSDSDGKKQDSDDENSTSSLEIVEEKTDVPKKKKKKKRAKSSDSSDSEPRPKAKRRRIKNVSSESNSSDEGLSSQNSSLKGRKNIRKVIEDKHIADDTKQAAIEEEERLKRIAERQKLYNEMYDARLAGEAKVDQLVLDFDDETKEELIRVDDELVKRLKPHQAKGIKFMWDACFESLERTKNTKGSGCIIAHCMGLGKTFQVVTLTHTLLNCEETGIKTVMIVCPLSTVLNWKNEFRMWLKNAKNGDDIEIFELTNVKKIQERRYTLEHWQRQGGVLIIGYEMYRNLTSPGKKMRKRDQESLMTTLVDPGPDVVVCDEGHLLKNEKSALSEAMRRVKTSRRIVLTGTPLQNNLIEYHCMVQFVKPNLLGTKKEFLNRFVNPINNGQYEDSTAYDVKLMKRRAHVLHKMLEGSVQRFDYSVLTPFLPPKQEYVISVHLTDVQKKMYQHYLENFARRHRGAGGSLFADFQALQRIWTHPKVMKYNEERTEARREKARLDDSEGSLKDFIDDGSESESSERSGSGGVQTIGSGSDNDNAPARRRTRATATASDLEPEPAPESREPAWWEQFVEEEQFDDMRTSVKLQLLFGILKECEQIGDKLLVFSQSLYSLSLIEEFLAKIDDATQENQELETLDKHTGSWTLGQDYFRLDGQTSPENRSAWCKSFNRETNTRARLFLISTRAGGLGINLTAANRVVIFDASWNPSHDVQSIFRIYRFGQKKPCYIYRFLAAGTMEEKIYKRQVTKLSLACRVVDEQQIERHYSGHNLAELYSFDPSEPDDRTLNCPKDRLLAEIFLKYPRAVKDFLEHDSLLENKEDEELDETEREQAWKEYEDEKKGKRPMMAMDMDMGLMGMMANGLGGDITEGYHMLLQMMQQDNNSKYPKLASTSLMNNMYQNVDNSLYMQNSISSQYPVQALNTNLSQQQQQLLQNHQQKEKQYLQQLQYSQAYGNRVPNARVPGPSHQGAYLPPSSMASTYPLDDDIEASRVVYNRGGGARRGK